jgi:hypothetical protein
LDVTKKIHQAKETPFAGGAKNTVLYDLLGYTGMSKAAKDVVEGTFMEKYGDELGDILPETKQVIRELAMPEEIKVQYFFFGSSTHAVLTL